MCVAVFLIVCIAASAYADQIKLKNGEIIEGEILHDDGQEVALAVEGGTMVLNYDEIDEISKGDVILLPEQKIDSVVITVPEEMEARHVPITIEQMPDNLKKMRNQWYKWDNNRARFARRSHKRKDLFEELEKNIKSLNKVYAQLNDLQIIQDEAMRMDTFHRAWQFWSIWRLQVQAINPTQDIFIERYEKTLTLFRKLRDYDTETFKQLKDIYKEYKVLNKKYEKEKETAPLLDTEKKFWEQIDKQMKLGENYFREHRFPLEKIAEGLYGLAVQVNKDYTAFFVIDPTVSGVIINTQLAMTETFMDEEVGAEGQAFWDAKVSWRDNHLSKPGVIGARDWRAKAKGREPMVSPIAQDTMDRYRFANRKAYDAAKERRSEKVVLRKLDDIRIEGMPLIITYLGIGDISKKDVYAKVGSRYEKYGVDGVLGRSFLKDFYVQVDRVNSELILIEYVRN